MDNVCHSGGIEKERTSSMSNYNENAEFISIGNLRMNDVFIGCYSRPLDGRRLCVPPEWARVFRDGGGVVAVEFPNERLALTIKEIAEKSSSAESLKAVHCKMDSRGR